MCCVICHCQCQVIANWNKNLNSYSTLCIFLYSILLDLPPASQNINFSLVKQSHFHWMILILKYMKERKRKCMIKRIHGTSRTGKASKKTSKQGVWSRENTGLKSKSLHLFWCRIKVSDIILKRYIKICHLLFRKLIGNA